MEFVRITDAESSTLAATKAADVLRAGGIILYPTDTIYGLGADALSDNAVAKIYAIKGRDEGKPIHALVDTLETAERYAEIPEEIQEKIERMIPCPISFIFKKRSGLHTGIAKNIDTFGFRIPNNIFCLELTKEFGGPITATSANTSGILPETSLEKILEQLGDATKHIGLVIDAGVLPQSLPSTVVDITSGLPHVLREAAVSTKEIEKIFG